MACRLLGRLDDHHADRRQDLTKVLEEADPELKAEVYTELGISVKYDPVLRIVHVEA
jgi:hypothetical protein